MRSIACCAILCASSVASAERLAPYATREAVVGCWNVERGATLELTPVGKHSLHYRATFATTPRGGPSEFTGDATWVDATKQFEVGCRPRSEHGSFCRVLADPAGLRVLVYAHPYNSPTTGRLVENFVAKHCHR